MVFNCKILIYTHNTHGLHDLLDFTSMLLGLHVLHNLYGLHYPVYPIELVKLKLKLTLYYRPAILKPSVDRMTQGQAVAVLGYNKPLLPQPKQQNKTKQNNLVCVVL